MSADLNARSKRARSPGSSPSTTAQAAAPPVAARSVGLRYVSDASPGIRRRRAGRGFVYIDTDGGRVTASETLARIRSLAIPPAWTDVWICPLPNGHIQATGRDARGRKQYRYHPRWREVRDETKFDRMIAFGVALPRIRARTEADLSAPGLPRERVLALVVRLLETSLIRVGNEEYARANGSIGLTTMRNRNVRVNGSELRFRFRGKSGVERCVSLRDRRLARLVQRCQELPGAVLFQYVEDDGSVASIDSGDVNDYLRAITGEEFTAKDFRTWAGTLLAARALAEAAATDGPSQATVTAAVKEVAQALGNTPAVCRACYIHPAVIDAYLRGALPDLMASGPGDGGERDVLALLRAHQRAADSTL